MERGVTDHSTLPASGDRATRLIAFGGLCSVAAAVWIPFGVWKTGLIEDWAFYALLDSHVPLWKALTLQSNRPFVMLGWAIGYFLTPNSFVGLNILHIFLMLGKGCLLYAIIVALLPRARFSAFSAAALFMIYPADHDLFATRVTNYQMAVFFYLAAVYCLIAYWKTRNRAWWIGVFAALLLDLGTIEVSYPLIVATPLVLWLIGARFDRRFVRTAVAWYAVPVLLVINAVVSSMRRGSYQQHVLSMENLTPAERVRSALFHFGRAYYQTLIGVWREVTGAGAASRLYLIIAAAVAVVIFAIGAVLLRGSSRDRRVPRAMCLGGLAVIGLGFLMFLPLVHRFFNEHVFLYSSAGAAMFIAGVASWIAYSGRIGSVIAPGVIALTMAGATVGALNIHLSVANLSMQEQHVLASMAEQMPSPPPQPSLVLIFDPGDELLNGIWHVGSSVEILQSIRYFYADPRMQAYVCHPERGLWGLMNEGCHFADDGIEIMWDGRRVGPYPYDRVVAFEFDSGSGALHRLDELPSPSKISATAAYDPAKLIDRYAQPPRRVHTLLAAWPFKPRLIHQFPADQVDVTFDYSVPGPGWWPPSHGIAWTNSKAARMDLLLRQGRDYAISFRITGALAPDIWDGLSMTANGQPVTLSWTADASGARIYNGRIDARLINENEGVARIVFRLAKIYTPQQLGMNDDTRFIGLGFDWIRVSSAGPSSARASAATATPRRRVKSAAPGVVCVYFDSVPAGSGWSMDQTSTVWMAGEESVLLVPLIAERYVIRFRVLGALDASVLHSLSLSIGTHVLPLTATSDDSGARIFTAEVPAAFVAANGERTALKFRAATAHPDIAFDWLEAVPAPSSPTT